MADSPWVMVTHLGRSRPFLLCVLLLLGGFLWLHYVTPSSDVRLVFAEVTVKDQVIEDNGLLKDVMTPKAAEPQTPKPPEVPVDPFINDNQINTTVSKPVRGICRKKFDVSFLKVHKAGSTTLMNIFLRFAISNTLNIVLPRKSNGYGFNYLGYGESVSEAQIVPIPQNETYNILCNHVVYDREAFRAILPSDTVYVGIIREPVSHFTSAASYYGFYKHLVKIMANTSPNRVVSEFLKRPTAYKAQTYFVYNRMSFDFGIPKVKFHDDVFVQQYIQELDRDYSLIMILERFPESLVLMRRILCWDTKDILYVPLNAMGHTPYFNLDEYDIENLRHWNSADFRLYSHFYEVFDSKVTAQGQDLQDEVESFKSIQEKVKLFCNSIEESAEESVTVLNVPATKWGDGFVVTVKDCDQMMEAELPMMKRLIDQAWVKYNKSLKGLR